MIDTRDHRMSVTETTGSFHIKNGKAFFYPQDNMHEAVPLLSNPKHPNLIDGDSIALKQDADGTIKNIRLLSREREVVVVFDQGHCYPLHDIGVETIELEETKGLKTGDIVVVTLGLDEQSKRPHNQLVDHLKFDSKARLEAEIVLRKFSVPVTHSRSAVESAQQRVESIVFEDELKWRKDLRDTPFVTIDGENAQDFDDAIHCEPNEQGWAIQVAIADVSYYVLQDSSLDQFALERGNSVYLPGNVVPMLPEVLSNMACSLRQDEEKLVLVCRMQINHQADIVDYNFVPAVIRSHARLTYQQVHGFLQGKATLGGVEDKSVRTMLRHANKAYAALKKSRDARGVLEFDTKETMLLFNEEGYIRSIIPQVRNTAHCLIEEFMICANRCSAQFLEDNNKHLLYRSHEGLKQNSLGPLKAFLRVQGLVLGGEEGKDLHKLLSEAKQHRNFHVIQLFVLQSLMRAVYSTENKGHYGLMLQHYTHFTSPIRRYPDLLIHRMIHAVLGSDCGADYSKKALDQKGQHCSMTEKRADSVVYDFEKYLKCIYCEQHIGKTFSGLIVAVTHFGVFVELEGIFAEGLLHVKQMDDFYVFDETQCSLRGESSGKQLRIGDRLEVVLTEANAQKRRIHVGLPKTQKRQHRKGRRRR
ncbi:MAG: ribonuclease R family protein [Candidatus Oxydemutatoraceae bacterium WSBS_2016_MAG_OTU14]